MDKFGEQNDTHKHQNSASLIYPSKNSIIKPYGGRPNFQASYGLKMTPDDIKEGNVIIEGLRKAEAEDRLQSHAQAEGYAKGRAAGYEEGYAEGRAGGYGGGGYAEIGYSKEENPKGGYTEMSYAKEVNPKGEYAEMRYEKKCTQREDTQKRDMQK